MVLLQAKDSVEAIRLRAHRLAVIRGGKVIAGNAWKFGEELIHQAVRDPCKCAAIGHQLVPLLWAEVQPGGGGCMET